MFQLLGGVVGSTDQAIQAADGLLLMMRIAQHLVQFVLNLLACLLAGLYLLYHVLQCLAQCGNAVLQGIQAIAGMLYFVQPFL